MQNQPEQSVQQHLDNAINYHQQGDFQQAAQIYRQLLQENPDQPDVLHLLGIVTSQLGQDIQAIEIINQAIAKSPDSENYYTDLALIHFNSGHHDEAVKICEQTLQMNPENTSALLTLGNSFFQQERYEDAVLVYQKVVTLNPDDATANFNLGNALRELGKVDEAVSAFEHTLRIHSGYIEAHNNLGNLLRELGEHERAANHLREALILFPDYVEAHTNLGIVLKDLERLDEAREELEFAIQLNPDFAEAYNHLGTVLDKLGIPDEALSSLNKAIELKPDYADAHNNLGSFLFKQKKLDTAKIEFQIALELNPDFAEAMSNMGSLYLFYGDMEKAKMYLENAMKIKPNFTDAMMKLAGIGEFNFNNEVDIERITQDIENNIFDESDSETIHFTLGKVYDDCGKFDKAIHHYNEGNRIKRKKMDFNRDIHRQYIDDLIEIFSENYFENCNIVGDNSRRPVFIIGMPRSGTTLVEQIISSHERCFGADELTYFNQIAATLPELLGTNTSFPACMSLLDQSTAQDIIRDYLDLLSTFSVDVERVTDKMPNNFLRLGLIAILFPNASFIHCHRSELDTCLSIYFQNFIQSSTLTYAYDLGDIGAYYFQYKRLMEHWRKVLPVKICDVEYESLVKNQDIETRRIIDFIGLPWDEHCLSFHETKRTVMTASFWQVRQPIYTSSTDRWKNYDSYLDPLKEALKKG